MSAVSITFIMLSAVWSFMFQPTLLQASPLFQSDVIWTEFAQPYPLAQYYIRDIAQDSTGKYWFAPNVGYDLVYYDGSTWSEEPAQQLYAEAGFYSLTSLLRDSHGDMWTASCFHSKIQVWRNSQWISLTDELSSGCFDDLIEDRSGNIWASDWFGGGVLRYDGSSWQRFTETGGLVYDRVNTIYLDSQGNIWIGTISGTSKFDGTGWKTFRSGEDGVPSFAAISIAEDEDGNIWFAGSYNQITIFDGMNWENLSDRHGDDWPIQGNIRTMTADDNGYIWVGTSEGVVVFAEGGWFRFTTEDGLGHPDVVTIFFDDVGAVWFGSSQGVVSKRQNGQWQVFSQDHSTIGGNRVESIAAAPDSSVWFGTYAGGVSQFSPDGWRSYSRSDGLHGHIVNAIASDGVGNIWAGFHWGTGVSVYDGKVWNGSTTADGLASNSTMSILANPDGTVWAGGYAKLSHYNGNDWVIYDEEDGVLRNWISQIISGKDAQIWFRTQSDRVNTFTGTEFITPTLGTTGSNLASGMTSDGLGNVWFSYGMTLSKYDGQNWISYDYVGQEPDNAPVQHNIIVHDVDHQGNIWSLLCSNNTTVEDYLTKFDGVTWTHYPLGNRFHGYCPEKVAVDITGAVWIAGHEFGVHRLQFAIPGQSFIVSGQILDVVGLPVADAFVEAKAIPIQLATTLTPTVAYITSSIDGVWSLLLPEGSDYTLTVTKTGYNFGAPLQITSRQTNTIIVQAVSQVGIPASGQLPIEIQAQASPVSVPADGETPAIVTISLRTSEGIPIVGKRIKLVTNRGDIDIITDPTTPTNDEGVVTAEIRSFQPGITAVSLWNLSDGLLKVDAIALEFVESNSIPRSLENRVSNFHEQSRKGISQILSDSEAILDEAIYARGKVGEQVIRVSAGVLKGLLGIASHLSSPAKAGTMSEIIAPGWSIWKDAPAAASPVVCQISRASLKYLNDENPQLLLRTALRYGLLLQVAQFKNECLSDVIVDEIADSVLIGNLISAYLERPFVEAPLHKQVNDELFRLQNQKNRLDNIKIPPLSDDKIAAYHKDLIARLLAIQTYKTRIRYVRETLESIHQANETTPIGGHLSQAVLRIAAQSLSTYFFDGVGKLATDSLLNGFDTYMDAQALTEFGYSFAQAKSALIQTSPMAIAAIGDNAMAGIVQIERGQTPLTPEGEIVSIQHVSNVSLWDQFLNEDEVYSLVKIKNTGQAVATFQLTASYLADTTRLLVPWSILRLQVEELATLQPGEERTLKLLYKNHWHGYSPRRARSYFVFGDIDPSQITLNMLAINRTGSFFVDSDVTKWEPQTLLTQRKVPNNNNGNTVHSFHLNIDNLVVIDEPIVSFLARNKPGTLAGQIWVNNPYTETVTISVTQSLVDGMVLTSTNGQLNDNIVVWERSISALGTQVLTYTVTHSFSHDQEISLPAADLILISPISNKVLNRKGNEIQFQIPRSISAVYDLPNVILPNLAPTMIITLTNNSVDALEGVLNLIIDPVGASLVKIPHSVNLLGNNSARFEITLPSVLDKGRYVIDVTIATDDEEIFLFDIPLLVGTPGPNIHYQVKPANIVYPNGFVTYTLTAANEIDMQLNNVAIIITTPAELDFVSTGQENVEVQGNNILWRLGSMASEQPYTLTLILRVDQNALLPNQERRWLTSQIAVTADEIAPSTGMEMGSLVMRRTDLELEVPVLLEPANEIVVEEGTKLTYRWQPVVNAVSYEILQLFNPGNNLPNGNRVTLTEPTYIDEFGLIPGHYSWEVKAIWTNELESDTNRRFFSVAPHNPTNVQAQVTSCQEIKLTWNDNSEFEAGYHIYRNDEKIFDGPAIDGGSSEYRDENLTENTTYEYKVVAHHPVATLAGLTESVMTPNCDTPTFTLTISSVGNGTVSVSEPGPYSSETQVQLTAIPDEGWHFVRWESPDALGNQATQADITVTVTNHASYTAYFEHNDLLLPVSSIYLPIITR